MTSQPFDDIRALLIDLPAPDEAASAKALSQSGEASRLGELAEMIGWIAAWRGRAVLNRPIIALYAGAHAGAGLTADTRAQMEAIAAGVAPVSRAAQNLGAGLDVFDLAIDRPVPDLTEVATLSERACAATIAFGMEALAKQPDLLALGALGGGRIVAAAALAHALHGGAASDWADADMASRVTTAVARAKAESGEDPLGLLRQLGGREIAALVGAIIAARTQGVPVLIEGYTGLAAAAVLHALDPAALTHCRLGHAPAEPGGRRLAEALGLAPLLDIGVTADDGTGAVAALCLIRLACAIPVDAAP
jgi:nicotinate-nucleotide--dimethylbenzimidazole phosphoribosyltransferase